MISITVEPPTNTVDPLRAVTSTYLFTTINGSSVTDESSPTESVMPTSWMSGRIPRTGGKGLPPRSCGYCKSRSTVNTSTCRPMMQPSYTRCQASDPNHTEWGAWSDPGLGAERLKPYVKWYGPRNTPRSVTIAVINSPGVTSNPGL